MKIQSLIAFGLAVALTVSAQTSRPNERVKGGKTPKAQSKGGDWEDETKKKAAVKSVLEWICTHHQDGADCVGKDDCTKNLFKNHGNGMVVPDGSRAIIFDTYEQQLGAGRSVILAVPPPDIDLNDDNTLLKYALNYVHWKPTSSALAAHGVSKGPRADLQDWYCPEPKRNAILRVLKQMVQDQQTAHDLIGHDDDAAGFFSTYGGIKVPTEKGARVIVFDTDELGKGYAGHVWLELQPEWWKYWGNMPHRPGDESDCDACKACSSSPSPSPIK